MSLFIATKYQVPRLQTNPSGFSSTSFTASFFLYNIFNVLEFQIAFCNTERISVFKIVLG